MALKTPLRLGGVLRGERKKQEELKEMLKAEEGGDFSLLASIVKAVTGAFTRVNAPCTGK